MIELLVSVGRSLVEASWHTAAVTVKFYILFASARIYSKGYFSRDKLEDARKYVLEESRLVLATIFGIAALTLITGFELRPRFELLSELTALIYLGYLFYHF
ncbi:MAG: hypothetical protein ACLFTA_01255 [Candidatus Nanohaloarchaea archaeon]